VRVVRSLSSSARSSALIGPPPGAEASGRQ
jgi:hypothetical protein